MLGVERINCGEIDLVVTIEHRDVIAELRRGDIADWEHGDSDHAACLDAHVGLHYTLLCVCVCVFVLFFY